MKINRMAALAGATAIVLIASFAAAFDTRPARSQGDPGIEVNDTAHAGAVPLTNRFLSLTDFDSVSMVAVLADPAKFDGRAVRFAGFIGIGEGAAIFMDMDSLRHQITENSIYLDTTTCPDLHLFSKASGKCCGVRGIVIAAEKGPNDASTCTLQLRSWYFMPEPADDAANRRQETERN